MRRAHWHCVAQTNALKPSIYQTSHIAIVGLSIGRPSATPSPVRDDETWDEIGDSVVLHTSHSETEVLQTGSNPQEPL